MAGALNQAAGVIEKLIGHPFQWDAAVRTAVLIDKHPGALTDGEQLATLDTKALAARIGEIGQLAEPGEIWAVIIVHSGSACNSAGLCLSRSIAA